MFFLFSFFRSYLYPSIMMLLSLLLAGVVEGFGLVTMMPLLGIIVGGLGGDGAVSSIADNRAGQMVVKLLDVIGLQPTVPTLLTVIVLAILLKSILLRELPGHLEQGLLGETRAGGHEGDHDHLALPGEDVPQDGLGHRFQLRQRAGVVVHGEQDGLRVRVRGRFQVLDLVVDQLRVPGRLDGQAHRIEEGDGRQDGDAEKDPTAVQPREVDEELSHGSSPSRSRSARCRA